MSATHDAVWLNANLATLAEGGEPYGAIRDGVLATTGGRISWIGPRGDWSGRAKLEHDARGAWITPALIDCHTHLVYAGNRAGEFEQRLKGASYEEIARAGGGIQSTVRATRAASEAELAATASRRLRQWTAEGVTAIEIKSGYGLDTATELKVLRAARSLDARCEVRTTFLGAHALPEEYRGRADDYIALVCDEMLPAVAPLADAVDVFCESIAFNVKQTARVFAAAKKAGLAVKLHADQLSDTGGAQLAAHFGALSADHLEYTNEAGVEAMARSGTVAVLLPGAFYFLRETQLPPLGALRRHRVPIAIATDHNPGTSPVCSPLLAMNLASTLFRLAPEESLAGFTRNAARALGMQATHGTLEEGKRADFVLWEIGSPAELAYVAGANPRVALVRSGEILPAAA